MHLPDNSLLQGGKYRITRFIASGGFGCTYEAVHVMLGRRVAIKEFFVKDFCNRDESTSYISVGTQSKKPLVNKLKDKFINEARAISELSHPGIVTVSDVFEENGSAYFVMAYIDGVSIAEILKKRGTIPEAQAVRYIRQLCDALDYVHKHNRLHLDIKPANIMVDRNDNAILIDFGASKQYDEESGENTSTLVGRTPGYAPLEQMSSRVTKFSAATDIYAVGATLYKMLTGSTPPEATDLASGTALPPLPDDISPNVRNAVYAAMQQQRDLRPQSVGEFLAVLDGADIADSADDDVTLVEGSDAPDSPAQQPVEPQQPKPEQPKPQQPAPQQPKSEEPKEQPVKLSTQIRNVAILILIGVLAYVAYTKIKEAYDQRPSKVFGKEHVIGESPLPESQPQQVVNGIVEGHAWVDLGLSVKWATKNLGAESLYDDGDYYAWGNTDMMPVYADTLSYRYNPAANSKMYVDTWGALRPKYDAARQNWHGSWRMPSKSEFEELCTQCTWTWISRVNQNGYLVRAKNGNSIFLPAAGYIKDGNLRYNGTGGYYWCSTPYNDFNSNLLFFDSSEHRLSAFGPDYGLSIRPVTN